MTIENKADLVDYTLRKCGAPVIEINIAPEQIDDAIEDALDFFTMYHYEGTYRTFVSTQITQQDIDNGYIIVDKNISDILRVFGTKDNTSSGTGSFMNAETVIRKNAVLEMTGSLNMVSYYLAMQNIGFINNMFNSNVRYQHKKSLKRLIIEDWDSAAFAVGQYIVFEAFSTIDPETYNDMYNNSIFRSLAAAYVKLRWGNNLTKFSGIQLPGSVELNGEYIVAEAKEEIIKIEEEFILKFQEPDDFYIG